MQNAVSSSTVVGNALAPTTTTGHVVVLRAAKVEKNAGSPHLRAARFVHHSRRGAPRAKLRLACGVRRRHVRKRLHGGAGRNG